MQTLKLIVWDHVRLTICASRSLVSSAYLRHLALTLWLFDDLSLSSIDSLYILFAHLCFNIPVNGLVNFLEIRPLVMPFRHV